MPVVLASPIAQTPTRCTRRHASRSRCDDVRKAWALLWFGLMPCAGPLRILQLVLAVTLELDFQVHGHSDALDGIF